MPPKIGDYESKLFLSNDESEENDKQITVTWQMPGDEPPKPGDAPIPGKYLGFTMK